MSKIINILTWVLLSTSMILLMGFSSSKRGQQTYLGVDILIDKPANSGFVTQKNIETLFTNMGYGKENQPLSVINIGQLEAKLTNKPSIESANVYQTISGKVIISVKERTPIVRIYNQHNESFYIDQYGSLMPLSNQYSARVLIANGNIDIPLSTVNTLENLENRLNAIFKKSNTTAIENTELVNKLLSEEEALPGVNQLKGLFDMSQYINSNEFWKSQISQLYFNENKDIIMTPRIGNHSIVFGSLENFEEKFEKLMTFYKKGLNKTGWNEYSEINLKYKNQVVCTKR
ncbi:MAG: cell division protein FtsQ/DivIB [Salibacteraceae bacterium]